MEEKTIEQTQQINQTQPPPPNPVIQPAQNPIQPPTPPAQSQKNKKIPMIIISVILILAAGIGIYYLGLQKGKDSESTSEIPIQSLEPTKAIIPTTQPSIPVSSPSSSLKLKIFTSYDNKYSFEYPDDPDWKANEPNNPPYKFGTAACTKCTGFNVDYFQVVPVIFKTINEYKASSSSMLDQTDIKLGNLDAVKGVQSGSEQAGGSMIEIFVVHKGQGYLISQRYLKLYNKTKLNEFPVANPDILSTVKFL